MPAPIKDEFSGIRSAQRRYILRKVRDKKCVQCGEPSVTKYHCERHRTITRNISEIKRAAYRAVGKALDNGTIKRGQCWCGELGQAHHKDYSKPLEITWLCHVHHCEAHGGKTFVRRPIKVSDRHRSAWEAKRRYRLKHKPPTKPRQTAIFQ